MNNWQDCVAALVALWCAWCVVRMFIRPFIAQACTGCAGRCGQAKHRDLLNIE